MVYVKGLLDELPPPRRLTRHLAWVWALLFAFSGTSAEAAVPTEPSHEAAPTYSEYFSGAFTEYSLRGGLLRTGHSGLRGWTFDGGVRHSFPMYLGDTRLSYRYDSLESTDSTVTIHGSNLTLGIHPLYLALLSRGWMSHFIASLHLELGLGLQRGLRQSLDTSVDDARSGWGFVWSLGAGFDLPLMNPNRGSAPWLNVVYRYSGTTLAILEDIPGGRRTHALFAG
ncbi:MAG: hypothetical protein ACNA8W_25825, partial [Bradymonadaceae bacterium]